MRLTDSHPIPVNTPVAIGFRDLWVNHLSPTAWYKERLEQKAAPLRAKLAERSDMSIARLHYHRILDPIEARLHEIEKHPSLIPRVALRYVNAVRDVFSFTPHESLTSLRRKTRQDRLRQPKPVAPLDISEVNTVETAAVQITRTATQPLDVAQRTTEQLPVVKATVLPENFWATEFRLMFGSLMD